MNKELEDYHFQELDALYNQARLRVKMLRDSGKEIYPESGMELACLFPLESLSCVKVVIVGQDPYINPGQAHGLAFSVQNGASKPPSLINIFKELEEDLGIPQPSSGCLDRWAGQGVLLVNRILTVERGKSKSHVNIGWEEFTEKLLRFVDELNSGIVFMLWGKDAQKIEPLLSNPNNLVLKASHPSPFSAHRGFFGCKHFSKANRFLEENGRTQIDWRL